MPSLAFPTSGKGSEKSCLRFAQQFVGNVNKKGEVLGFPSEMKLLTCLNGKSPRILLTKAGWRFGTIPNPVLEGTQATPMQKLSDEERSFLPNYGVAIYAAVSLGMVISLFVYGFIVAFNEHRVEKRKP